MKKVAIHWFRQDLRLIDNLALNYASLADETIVIYILDDNIPIGAASKLWLYHSLVALNKSLNNNLNFYNGKPLQIIKKLIKDNNITEFYWNRCYDKYSIARDSEIKKMLENNGIATKSFNGSLLLEPWQCTKNDNTHYKVYTAFYKALLKTRLYRDNIPKPHFNKITKLQSSTNLNNTTAFKTTHSWQNIIKQWQVGEKAAIAKLEQFLKEKINSYTESRDLMSNNSTSNLSPHLHFGEISPNQIFNAVYNLNHIGKNEENFIKEIVWRDFSYYQLYYYPELVDKNINGKFDKFKWQYNAKLLKAWQVGKTGIPLVDAGMRELWQTGYMHNRVRMVVASFLVKNCLVHWKYGERWFFDTLFDADIASNNANWQWIAGCGLDAAPYFRIFNPVLQADKFKAGNYIRKYIPELKSLSDKHISKPWQATPEVLDTANVKLGINYPLPLIDLKTSREKALALYKQLK